MHERIGLFIAVHPNKPGLHALLAVSLHVLPTEPQSRLNQNIMVLHLEERRCFDTSCIQTLLRFIQTVTGLQRWPKCCHIWDTPRRDHAL